MKGLMQKKACSQLTEVNHLKTVNHNLRTDIMVLVETKFDKIQQKLRRDLTLIMEKLAQLTTTNNGRREPQASTLVIRFEVRYLEYRVMSMWTGNSVGRNQV